MRATTLTAPALLLTAALALSGCSADADDPKAASSQGPSPVPAETLAADARTFGEAVLSHTARAGELPFFAESVETTLTPGVSVTQYAVSEQAFRFCIVSSADGAWVAFQSDRGGPTETGDGGECVFAE